MKLGLIASVIGGCAKNPFGSAFNQSYKPEFDCGFVQNVYGERISWKNNLPIKFYIHQSVPSEYRPVIESAMKKWGQAAGKTLFQVVSQSYPGPDKPRQDGLNVIYWLNTWDSNRSTEQGRTSVYWLGNEIRETDIRINAFNFDYYIDEPKSLRDVHFESLIIHELGHVLGLKHRDEGQSVMGTYLAVSAQRNTISSIDISALQCEYRP
jgi:hypothetical protein